VLGDFLFDKFILCFILNYKKSTIDFHKSVDIEIISKDIVQGHTMKKIENMGQSGDDINRKNSDSTDLGIR
jgi:hypothetical protein